MTSGGEGVGVKELSSVAPDDLATSEPAREEEETALTAAATRAALLEPASPRRLWIWAWSIALVGLIARLLWFDRWGDELAGFGSVFSGHFWSLNLTELGATGGGFNPLEATRAFAPGYGALLRGLVELTSGAADPFVAFNWTLMVVQSLLVAAATLLTFALSRRVLFGAWALLPPALLTISVALLELPGGMAVQVPLMFMLVLAVWLLTLLRERAPELAGISSLLLTIAAGLAVGGCVLFDPSCLLLALLVVWWSFRGLGREHAILLLVSVLLLPASWLAVVQSEVSGGVPTEQIGSWLDQSQILVDTPELAAERAYALVTPWNPRFSRGAWSSMNWNYEWILPFSVRGETTYLSATRALAAVWMLLYLALVIGGLVALMLEGAGAAARLVAFPVLTLPLATFVVPTGGLLRVPILPFLMIALALGAAWLLSRAGGDRTA